MSLKLEKVVPWGRSLQEYCRMFDLTADDLKLALLDCGSRVAKEVRVFPVLVNFTGEVSPFLQPVMSQLSARGYQAELKQVPYEFQRNGNQLLRISLAHL